MDTEDTDKKLDEIADNIAEQIQTHAIRPPISVDVLTNSGVHTITGGKHSIALCNHPTCVEAYVDLRNSQTGQPVPTETTDVLNEDTERASQNLVIDPHVRARALVAEYYDDIGWPVNLADVKLVWFSKVLKNWKAIVIALNEDNRLFEVTYSGENHDTQLDVYAKVDEKRILD